MDKKNIIVISIVLFFISLMFGFFLIYLNLTNDNNINNNLNNDLEDSSTTTKKILINQNSEDDIKYIAKKQIRLVENDLNEKLEKIKFNMEVLKKENKKLLLENKNIILKLKKEADKMVEDIKFNKKNLNIDKNINYSELNKKLEGQRERLDNLFTNKNDVFTKEMINEKKRTLKFKIKNLEYNTYFLEKILNKKIDITNKNKLETEVIVYKLRSKIKLYKKLYNDLIQKIDVFNKQYKRLKSNEAKNLLKEIDYLENEFTLLEEKFDTLIEHDIMQDKKIKHLNSSIEEVRINTNVKLIELKEEKNNDISKIREEIGFVYDELHNDSPYIAKTLINSRLAIIDNGINRLTLKQNLPVVLNNVKYNVEKIDENCVYLKSEISQSRNRICK